MLVDGDIYSNLQACAEGCPCNYIAKEPTAGPGTRVEPPARVSASRICGKPFGSHRVSSCPQNGAKRLHACHYFGSSELHSKFRQVLALQSIRFPHCSSIRKYHPRIVSLDCVVFPNYSCFGSGFRHGMNESDRYCYGSYMNQQTSSRRKKQTDRHTYSLTLVPSLDCATVIIARQLRGYVTMGSNIKAGGVFILELVVIFFGGGGDFFFWSGCALGLWAFGSLRLLGFLGFLVSRILGFLAPRLLVTSWLGV